MAAPISFSGSAKSSSAADQILKAAFDDSGWVVSTGGSSAAGAASPLPWYAWAVMGLGALLWIKKH